MTTHKAPWRTIYFRLEAPDAAQVSVVGDFNDWDAGKHGLHKKPDGVWECQVPLPPGRYAYHFIVDGASRLDPHCELREPRAGGTCCVIEVSPPEE
jgi:1,4-alpha-glucan branching enzyme